MMNIRNIVISFAAGVFTTTAAYSSVILKNGNFHVGYDDLIVDKSSGLEFTRYYNSIPTHKGWLGFGWGTAFETQLLVMPDGMVAAIENGNGHVTLYGQPSAAALNEAVDTITLTLIKEKLIKPSQEISLRKELQSDPMLRLYWSKRLHLPGMLPEVGVRMHGEEFESDMDRFARLDDLELARYALFSGKLEVAAELQELKYDYIDARRNACGQLLRTKEGFDRAICSNNRFGDQQQFDLHGRLIQLNTEGNWLRLEYGKSPYPQNIINESGKSIALKWNAQGFVEQISGIEDGRLRTNRYAYDKSGNLLSIDMNGGNRYDYSYDDNHLLTQIKYVDDSTKTIQYDQDYRVAYIKQRNGNFAKFDYQTNNEGETLIRYLSGVAGEEPHLVQMLSYNKRGQLLMNRDSTSSIELEYHPINHLITRHKTNDIDCRYIYNDKSNITQEKCPQQDIDNMIEYDGAGHIVRTRLSVPAELRGILDDQYVTLEMVYDSLGRMTKIKEIGHSAFAWIDYRDDKDREGRTEIPDNQTKGGMFRFIKVTDLQSQVMGAIEKRTRTINGFAVAEE